MCVVCELLGLRKLVLESCVFYGEIGRTKLIRLVRCGDQEEADSIHLLLLMLLLLLANHPVASAAAAIT